MPGLLPELCENPLQVRGQPQLFLQVKKSAESLQCCVSASYYADPDPTFSLISILMRIRILPRVLHMLELFKAVPAYIIFLIIVKGVIVFNILDGIFNIEFSGKKYSLELHLDKICKDPDPDRQALIGDLYPQK